MIHELTTRTVERIPELSERPDWDGPWHFQRGRWTGQRISTLPRPGGHWWRMDKAGTIYRVEADTGEVRRF